MPLMVGARLGPYEISGLLGAGGMGEVYRARDTRLDRTVAIKVLPAGLHADPERRARFDREAKTIAGLTHPHICTLYDVGDCDGAMFLVMEHLEGETLAHRIAKGPLPIDQALAIAIDIADALSAAHRHGVIHRDLKPANVMLTRAGAKLLDFGLAKLTERGEQAAVAPFVSLPTRTAPLTGEGVIAGTLQYMAPEQLEGKPADARSDLWAFGAIAYEMLTGEPAFAGESGASLIAAILERDPVPVASIRPLTPPSLDRLITKCLRKDPDTRWQSAADLADDCRWLATSSEVPAAVDRAPANAGSRWPALWVAGLALAGMAMAGAAWFAIDPARLTAVPVGRFTVSVGQEGRDVPSEVAVSPDGRTIVFASTEQGVRRLFRRRLDEWEAKAIPGTEDATVSSFSPDGAWLAFASSRGLYRVPMNGGPPVPVYANAALTVQPSIFWESATRLVFSTGLGGDESSVWRVALDGSPPELLVKSRDVSTRYLHPQTLSGGRTVLFTIFRHGHASVAAMSLDTQVITVIRDGASHGRYMGETGHLVYQADDRLLGMLFDPQTLQARGALKVVAEEVGNSDVLHSEYDVSATGTLVHLPTSDVRLMWVTRNGLATPVTLVRRAQSGYVAVSPDGRRAVLSIAKEYARQLYKVSLDGEVEASRLTPGDDDYYGVFTPDGLQVLFTAPGEGGGYQVFSTRSDGGGVPVLQTTGGSLAQNATSVLPVPPRDTFLYNRSRGDGMGRDIWRQRLGRPDTAEQVIRTAANEVGAVFSPDGRWIAYQSNESGQHEVYVKGYPEGPKHQVSIGGGTQPQWNPQDGGELFYEQSAAIFAIRIADGARIGQPSHLFDRPSYGLRNWAVAPDGQRFLVAFNTRPHEIAVVTNWFEELKARAPVK